MFEKIILNRLNGIIEENNVLQKEQFDFRKDHSTVHQVRIILILVTKNELERQSTGIICLDIKKDFDCIWHDGLVYKLKMFGFYLQTFFERYTFRS